MNRKFSLREIDLHEYNRLLSSLGFCNQDESNHREKNFRIINSCQYPSLRSLLDSLDDCVGNLNFIYAFDRPKVEAGKKTRHDRQAYFNELVAKEENLNVLNSRFRKGVPLPRGWTKAYDRFGFMKESSGLWVLRTLSISQANFNKYSFDLNPSISLDGIGTLKGVYPR